MRLEAIEKPQGLKARFAYWASKRQFGKAITPLTVAYARVPEALNHGYAISKFLRSKLSLDPELRLLIQTHTARINGCDFCVDIGEALATGTPELLDKCRSVTDFETDARFRDDEQAALRYVREVTENGSVSDETFDALRPHFTDREIVEITLINAIESYFNMVNIPLEIESDGLCSIALSRKGRETAAAGAG